MVPLTEKADGKGMVPLVENWYPTTAWTNVMRWKELKSRQAGADSEFFGGRDAGDLSRII